jgi:hypothetical protein
MDSPYSDNMLRSEGGLSAVSTQYKPLLDNFLSNRLANAFYHNYLLTSTEAEEIQSYFPRFLVLQKVGAGRLCSHPVLAVLNEYANSESQKQIESARSRGEITISLGDSADGKIRANHNCLCFGRDMSSKDNTRVAQTRASSNSQKSAAIFGMSTPACTKGAQNCNFQADHGFSVNSIYDVTFDQFATAFLKHGLKTMSIYMLVAPELIDPAFTGTFPCFRTQIKDDQIIFSMRDFSAPYVHSVSNWRMWMTTSVIDCGSYAITLERVRSYGPLTCIAATLITRSIRDFYITLPLTTWYSDHSLVPDVVEWLHRGSALRQHQLRHYVVPNNVILALFSYCERTADDAYKYNEIASYASGLRRSIIIGGKTYQDKWECGAAEYSRVLVSLFILGAITRTNRTQAIKFAFNYLKYHYEEAPWYKPIQRFFGIATAPEAGADGSHLPRFTPIPIEDRAMNNVYHFGGILQRVQDNVERAVRYCIHKMAIGTCLLCVERTTTATLTQTDDVDYDAIYSEDNASTDDVAPMPVESVYCELPNSLEDIFEPEPNRFAERSLSLSRVSVSLSSSVADAPPVVSPPQLFGEIFPLNDFSCFWDNVDCDTPSSHIPVPALSPIDLDLYEEKDTEECFNHLDPVLPTTNDEPDLNIDSCDCAFAGTRHTQCFVKPSATTRTKRGKVITSNLSVNNDLSLQSCTCNLSIKQRELFDKQIADISSGRNVLLPKTFSNGHCAIQAFRTAVGTLLQPLPEVKQLFRVLANELSLTYTPQDLACYIHHGRADLFVSCGVVAALARAYKVSFELVIIGQKSVLSEMPDSIGRIRLYHNGIDGAGGHYSAFPLGGAKRSIKFARIIRDNLISGTVLDASAAPGDFSMQMSSIAGVKLTTAWFQPGLKMLPNNGLNVVPYREPSELARKIDRCYDFIFNDAARECGSEIVISKLNDHVVPKLKEGGCLISKSFGNGHDIMTLYAEHFDTIDERIYADQGTERYFTLRGYTATKRENSYERFFAAYEDYNRENTMHKLPTPRDLKTFTDEYFKGEMAKHKPLFRAPPAFDSFTVEAITGVASAAKTTNAIKKYPQAVFVAPSRVLSQRHQALGVRSYTPHVLFSSFKEHDRDPDVIVIDEISQFPVHYVALVHARFTFSKIVVLGDVMQTPFVNYGSRVNYATVISYGLSNNILTAYKIPQDIAACLNNRHALNILSMSPVKQGICFYKGVMERFAGSKIPVIVFNDASMKNLRDRGVNAHTITTYTGSRDHTVVFYIDSASVASQIVNKTEWLYTAMSRATDQLVIAGETDVIANYYAIHGSPIKEFENISGAYIQNDIKVPIEQVFNVVSPISVANISASAECAESILQMHLKPINDPDNEFLLATNPVLPAVQSGYFYTQTDAAMNPDSSTKAYKISLSKFVKNQISSSTEQTLATLIKRYSKKYTVPMTKSVRSTTLSELKAGLMRALYNRSDSQRFEKDMAISSEQLRDFTLQYYDKLQIKMNSNKSVAKELLIKWEEVDECLSFFNKRQSKFDPKTGFDMSDKVGQGVAANSKAVNIIFGGYARAMIEKVRGIAIKNRRNIILATHDSEAQINDTYLNLINDAPRDLNWACNDFSEWDASFRTPFADLTAWLLRLLGASEELVKWFSDFRASWTMIYRNKYGTTKLRGTEKQFSGNPFTIVENTIGNLALCFAIFNYKKYQMALFKGDDSAVLCKESVISTRGKEIIAVTGHGLKLHTGSVGEFAGWFLTPEGIFPDVVRYAAKFLDKNYRDEEHFYEARASLQERLSAVKSQSQVEYGLHMISDYYRGIGLFFTHGEIENLYAFIKASRNISFAKLRPVTLPNLNSN